MVAVLFKVLVHEILLLQYLVSRLQFQKSQMYQLTEDSLQKKDGDVVGLMVARDTAEQRAEAAEIKVSESCDS